MRRGGACIKSKRHVTGHEVTGVPGNPGFGLLGWLTRAATLTKTETLIPAQVERSFSFVSCWFHGPALAAEVEARAFRPANNELLKEAL